MFERILLCYEGSSQCQAALERTAELAKLTRAGVYLLGLTPPSYRHAAILASTFGTICLAENPYDESTLVTAPLQWLRDHDVVATGQLALRSDWEYVVEHARSMAVDVIVLARYPQSLGSLWWPTGKRPGGRARCCILEVAPPE